MNEIENRSKTIQKSSKIENPIQIQMRPKASQN